MLLAPSVDIAITGQTPRLLSRYSVAADVALRAFDLSLVVATALLAYWGAFGNLSMSTAYRVTLGTVVLYALLSFSFFPVYQSWRGRPWVKEAGVLGVAWGCAFALMAFHTVLIQWNTPLSPRWLGTWFVLGLFSLGASRAILRNVLNTLRASGADAQRVVAVGLRNPVLKVHHELQRAPWIGIELMGYFRGPHDVVPASEETLACLGDESDLEAYLQNNEVDQVWVSVPLSAGHEMRQVMSVLDRYPLDVKWVPDLVELGVLNQSTAQIGSVPMINLRQGGAARDHHMAMAKGVEDVLVALLGLVVLWPVLLVAALAVKATSPGPVFFKQKRHGLHGREFHVLKFRSMVVHQAKPGVAQATQNDARVTPVGKFLRRTSIDELPQIFNVLRGDMAIVGPRPHAAQHNDHYQELIQRYMQRHYVKPGITGWAQVNGFRGETPDLRTMKKRVQYDLDYIRRWSLWLDIKIIVLTAFRVLNQKTAY